MPEVQIRGKPYPVLLPTLRDPRLHLAATITSLQVIGQIGFHFQVSIAQILLCLGTCAVLEMAIALRRDHVVLWPASAMLTGNGVAFVLRVPGTAHGDWWSMRGWWIFVATAAGSLLSKHVIRWRGEHIFNPSNIGLVVCFLVLGRNRAAPLDFWWGPTSAWLVLALVVIVTGGFAILRRLRLLRVALGFWASFAAGIGIIAASGHAMTARWHLGPIEGFHLWWVLVTSPEVLVFLFFMITDPKTAPRGPRARVVYAVGLGTLSSLLIAPMETEYASKVALLGALAIVCLARPLAGLAAWTRERAGTRAVALAAPAVLGCWAALLVVLNSAAPSIAAAAVSAGALPPVDILPSRGVQSQLTLPIAQQIERALVASQGVPTGTQVRMWLEVGEGQGPPTAVAQVANLTYRLHQAGTGWALGTVPEPAAVVAARTSSALAGRRLVDVAAQAGLDFREGAFRFGMSNEYQAMMGGGVCWIDYNGDGRLDLFVVNGYSSADTAQWTKHGGLPRTQLYENLGDGRFRNVSRQAHADLAVQGDGCVAADLNGDGRPDLLVTTTSGIELLWNNENGTFTQGARAAGMTATGWYTGAAVADVNGDGRPDVFVAGYSDPNEPVPNSLAGFPTNLAGVRDLLYLNEGGGHFREVGVQAGLESALPRHGLGAVFFDYNGDGRPDLYVANDEDPNSLYENVPWPGGVEADPAGLGFRFEERGAAEGVADRLAGMGIATGNGDLVVTNSRREPTAAFRRLSTPGSPAFGNDRTAFDPALGTGFAGWGASWVDLTNSGSPDLIVAAGGIPVTSLTSDAESMRVLAPVPGDPGTYGAADGVLPAGLRLNGRGVAAADVDNDGRMEIAVNTIGGKLALLRPTGPVGHWLDVRLAHFAPGAVVTVELPDGRKLTRTVEAGSSYLSSEDPRVHFGLGSATHAVRVTVRYPFGGTTVLRNARVDRVLTVPAAARTLAAAPPAMSPLLAGCSPSRPQGVSIAALWNRTAVEVLRAGDAPEPVQARDLYDVSAAVWNAWRQTSSSIAVSYAAYRVLLWDASYDANLERTFSLLTTRLQSLCYSPAYTNATGSSPAAAGNRVAAATIAAGRHDGSLEALHFLDASYVPENEPLTLSQPGSTARDPTFWQPLGTQRFVDSQWGHVRGFGVVPRRPSGPKVLAIPSSGSYKEAAIAVIRATSGSHAAATASSPLAWNELADSLPGPSGKRARLAYDVRVELALNGALEDAAIATWGAKRTLQAPRPITMIRYLAFTGQSSSARDAAYNPDGLPLVPGLTKLVGDRVEVLSRGHWIPGARWTPPAATPASPGGVAEASAFAYAADTVLHALTGRSFAQRAQAASSAALTGGIDTPSDLTSGRAIGERAGRAALAKLGS